MQNSTFLIACTSASALWALKYSKELKLNVKENNIICSEMQSPCYGHKKMKPDKNNSNMKLALLVHFWISVMLNVGCLRGWKICFICPSNIISVQSVVTINCNTLSILVVLKSFVKFSFFMINVGKVYKEIATSIVNPNRF